MKISFQKVINVFARSEKSLKNYFNVEELWKIFLSTVMAGGGLLTLLREVNHNLSSLITDQTVLAQVQAIIGDAATRNWVALLFATMTLLCTAYQKYKDGETPVK